MEFSGKRLRKYCRMLVTFNQAFQVFGIDGFSISLIYHVVRTRIPCIYNPVLYFLGTLTFETTELKEIRKKDL